MITLLWAVCGAFALVVTFYMIPLVGNPYDFSIILLGSVVTAVLTRAFGLSIPEMEKKSVSRVVQYLFVASCHWVVFSVSTILTSVSGEMIADQSMFVTKLASLAGLLTISLFWYFEYQWRKDKETSDFLKKQEDASG